MNRTPAFFLLLLAVAAIAVATTFLDVADTLPLEIERALRAPAPAPEADRGVEILIVHEPPRGALKVVQLMLLALLLGGIPAALVAIGLRRIGNGGLRRRGANWAWVFSMGFTFQASSALVTLLLLGGISAEVLWAPLSAREFLVFALAFVTPCLFSVGCSALVLPVWQSLRADAGDVPLHGVGARTPASGP